MQRLKFLRHTTPRACSRLSARESIYMCSVVSARSLILARAYPAIAITANKILPARPKIPVGVSQNHCAMVKAVFSAFRRFDSMLVKGMLRLCHLLVIRLSCSAHPCAQLHLPLLSQYRVCNVLLDPSLAGGLSRWKLLVWRGHSCPRVWCVSAPEPSPDLLCLCALRLKGTTQHSEPTPEN